MGFDRSCQNGHIDIAKTLIDAGADVDAGLVAACKGGHMQLVELMIAKGAIAVNTGLKVACGTGWITRDSIVKLLILKGAVDVYFLKITQLIYLLNNGVPEEKLKKHIDMEFLISQRNVVINKIKSLLDGIMYEDLLRHVVVKYIPFQCIQ